MKKNNKFIATSIASMMLVAGMAMPKALAAGSTELRYARNSGYLTSDSNVIVVGLANGEKELTQDELRQLMREKYSLEVVEITETIKTGSKIEFTTGESATLVLYGDVDANGKIDYNDVQMSFDVTRGSRSIAANSAEFRAADIEDETTGDDAIDYNDVQRLFDYARDVRSDLSVHSSKLPVDRPVEIDSNVHIELPEGYINNVNEAKFPMDVKLDKALSKETTYTVSVLHSNGREVVTRTTPIMDDPEIKFSVISSGNNTEIAKEVELNFSDELLRDGTYTIVLKDEKGEIVATKEVEKKSDESPLPEAVKIKANRNGAHTAELSFLGHGSEEVKKIYYCVADNDIHLESSLDDGKTIREGLINRKVTKDGKNIPVSSMDITDNKLDSTVIITGLDETKSYRVWFVVVDKYGNVSQSSIQGSDVDDVYVEVISNGVQAPQEKRPDTVAISNGAISDGTEIRITATVNPTQDSSRKGTHFLVRLYDESGSVVEEQLVPISGDNPVWVTFKVNKGGKYKVGALLKGDPQGSTKESDEKMNEGLPIVVKQLSAPSAISFEEKADDDTKGTLAWNGVNLDTEANDVSGYKLEFEQYVSDADGWTPDNVIMNGIINGIVENPTPDGNNRINYPITNLKPNTVYKVTITAIAKQGSTGDTLNSVPVESSHFYTLRADSLLHGDYYVMGKNSITLKVDRKASGCEFNFETQPTYDVNIWRQSHSATDDQEFSYWKDVHDIRPVKSDDQFDYLTIDGLEENGYNYKFRLTLNYGGKSDTQAVFTAPAQTNDTLPTLSDLKVVGTPNGGDNTIYYYNTIHVRIRKNSKIYDILDVSNNNYYDPDKMLVALGQLKNGLNPNDVIESITPEKVTVKLNTEGNNSSNIRDFGTLDKKTFEIIGNAWQQRIKATVHQGDVILSGNQNIFDVTQVTVDPDHKIVASEGVELESLNGDSMPKVEVQNSATIWDVKVTGSTAYEAIDTNTFNTAATENALTFDAHTDKGFARKAIEVRMISNSNDSIRQSGAINIIGNGNIKLLSDPYNNVNILGDTTVDVTNGNVDLSYKNLRGKKQIKLHYTKGSTYEVKVVTDGAGVLEKMTSPVNLRTDLEYDDITGGATMSDEEKRQAANYLNSLGIDGKYNASLNYNAVTKVVTIQFSSIPDNLNATLNF